MRSRLISTICLLCIAIPAIASGSSEFSYAAFRAGMDSVFRYVDKQQVPTGILSDYGLHLIDPNPYNGVPSDTTQVNSEIWKILYTGLYYSKINDKITIKVAPIGEAQGISMASMDSPIEITANLYSDMSLVRTVSFSSAEKSADISTRDLPSGTYYLNILEGPDIVDRQVIIIKH